MSTIIVEQPCNESSWLERQTWVTFLGRAALLLLTIVALILVVRRLGGAFVQPLSSAGLACCGIFLASLTISARNAVGNSTAVQSLLTLLLVAAVVSVSLRGSPAAGVVMLWLCTVAEESWTWTRLFRRPAAALVSETITPPVDVLPDVDHAKSVANEVDSLDVRQHLTRGIAVDGSDVLEGEVHVVFATRQRIEHVHLAFCPPFFILPAIEFEQLDGPEAQISVNQLMAYGARLELKLAKPGPARVTLAICVRASGEMTYSQVADSSADSPAT